MRRFAIVQPNHLAPLTARASRLIDYVFTGKALHQLK
jgi:hypothetical protein